MEYNDTLTKQSNILVEYKEICERIKNIFIVERSTKSIPLMELCKKLETNLQNESKLNIIT